MFIACKESPGGGRGAGRYQCLVRNGGVSSPKRSSEARVPSGRKGKNGVVEKQRRGRNGRMKIRNDSSRGKKAGRSAARDALSRFFSRFFDTNSLEEGEAKFSRIFRNVPEESAGSSWKKTIRKDSRSGRGRQGFRLLNEINEKQRSAGGFNPL